MKKPFLLMSVIATAVLLPACTIQIPNVDVTKIGEGGRIAILTMDRAKYEPGKPVQFQLHLKDAAEGDALLVRYSHLSRQVKDETVKLSAGAAVWSWTPPKEDYQGYLVEVFVKKRGKYVDHAAIGVDVSTDWGKFPRYGYLADFPDMPAEAQKAVIDRLNRLHINGIQFYDWQSKHHEPLSTVDGKPAASWKDIANRTISAQTVKRYMDEAHARGMKAMNYNLLFGANKGFEQDGVRKEWGLFKDPLHDEQDHHPLPASWKSDIFLMDPGNKAWQDYLIAQEKKVFEALPFDGYHVDQLGDRGTLWEYNGKITDLPMAYQDFLNTAKQKLDVDYVMNAVNQYGQQQIAQSPVKFLYTEVWMDKFEDLKDILDQNNKFGNYQKNSVIAAYMDYDLANNSGEFNPPGVLLADAVIFAAGGAHIEAGENLLAKEYFPNRNLEVPNSLWKQLQSYYDFLVAYENLLRDSGKEAEPVLEAAGGLQLSASPEKGKLWTISKENSNTSMVHLINLANADSVDWKDANGTQPEPSLQENLSYRLQPKDGKKVKRIWLASPDLYSGSPIELSFKKNSGSITFTVPKLKYWDMIVIEYE